MWFSLIKNIVLSILFIYIAHTSWNYVLDVCTTKKKKNLVKIQNDKYASMVASLATSGRSLGPLSPSPFDMTDEDLAQMEASLRESLVY